MKGGYFLVQKYWLRLLAHQISTGEREGQIFEMFSPKSGWKTSLLPEHISRYRLRQVLLRILSASTKLGEKWNDAYRRLPKITQPTLIITGTDDVLTPPENASVIANRISGSWVVQLVNLFHILTECRMQNDSIGPLSY